MYYKIGDDIELSELEKYGFYDIGICYKAYLSNCQYLIDKGTKMIKRISPHDSKETPTLFEIRDLISAGLVEKVSD